MPVLITCGPPSSYPTLLIPYFRISAYPSIRILVFTNTSLRGTAKFHPPWSFPSRPPWLRTFGTSSTTTERSKWLRQPWNSDACEARPSGERFSLLVAPARDPCPTFPVFPYKRISVYPDTRIYEYWSSRNRKISSAIVVPFSATRALNLRCTSSGISTVRRFKREPSLRLLTHSSADCGFAGSGFAVISTFLFIK